MTKEKAPWAGEHMSTGRVGDPPAPRAIERGDPRSTLSGKAPSSHWEIYEDEAGEWRWRLRAPNGEVVASGEGYEDEGGVRTGISTVIATVNGAALGYGSPVIEVVDG